MTAQEKINVTHIIVDLKAEGAQTMLYRLLQGMDGDIFESRVISLTDVGPLKERIQGLGIPVATLGMRHGSFSLKGFLRLVQLLRKHESHVIQTWMYHADLIGGLAAWLAGKRQIVWNIRHSDFVQKSKRSTVWVRRMSAWLSRWLPAKIIVNAHSACRIHAALGYADDKMVVIPNGYDLDVFKPDPSARDSVRQELGVTSDARLIGLVARFALQKDHPTFIHAAGILLESHPEVHFVLCGDQIDWQNEELVRWIEVTGKKEHFHLLGRRDDMPQLTAAVDIATMSSSHGEAFPNVVAEAMACEVPCVVTDSGDAAEIVGETGIVVEPRNPGLLADGWAKILSLSSEDREKMGSAGRKQIEAHYQLSVINKIYEKLYQDLALSFSR